MRAPGTPAPRLNPDLSSLKRAFVLLWFAGMWVAWMGFNVTYLLIRGAGDDLSSPHNIGWLERALPGPTPGPALQDALYSRDLAWVDEVSFLAHGFWFGVPFAFGLVLMIYRRHQLIEYLAWTVVLIHLAALLFLVLPVRPPWIEGGVVRVLDTRNFYAGKTEVDNNPYAAMPSLHAALPAMTAMYFWWRVPKRLRFYAWLATAYTAWVSFAIIYLGEHWLLDVLGGYAVAGLSAWLCMSPRMHALYARIPGDPVGRCSRVNSRLTRPQARPRPNAIPEPAPESLPRAA